MKPIVNDRYEITYKVLVTGIPYYIKIFHQKRKHRAGQYEVEYAVNGQVSPTDRNVGKNLKHVNDLLLIIENVLREVVTTRLYIKTILFKGVNDMGIKGESLRTRYTLRYLTNHDIFSEYKIRNGGDFIIITIR